MNLYRIGKVYEPPQGLQQEYFIYPTHVYGAITGPIADNVYNTAIQGVESGENWYNFTPVQIRTIPATTSPTGELLPDDWQKIFIIKPVGLSYISPGAYLFYNNNWWIVYKPENLSVGIRQATVRRCNATINVLDYYGNVVQVPMSFAKMGTLGNASHATENSIVAKNYISCICQYNKTSADFAENTRIFLGKTCYAMRGVNNFTREYTEDENSVHIISFTVERVEALPQDDIERGIANGLAFSWEIVLEGVSSMNVNTTQTITPSSVRNGQGVVSSAANPVGYTFTSSDESVLTVDENGLVSAIAEGNATVTVSLQQNPEITSQIEISVSALGEGLNIMQSVDEIRELQSAEISAVWIENGSATEDVVHFEFSGPPEQSYEAVQTAPNSYTITCYSLSATPLTVTIHHKGESKTLTIRLRG